MRLTATLLSTAAAVLAMPALAQDQTSPVTTNAAVAGQSDTASAQSGDTGLLNAGDMAGAAAEFMRWTRSGGRELLGLRRRRTAEQALFHGASGPAAVEIGQAVQ